MVVGCSKHVLFKLRGARTQLLVDARDGRVDFGGVCAWRARAAAARSRIRSPSVLLASGSATRLLMRDWWGERVRDYSSRSRFLPSGAHRVEKLGFYVAQVQSIEQLGDLLAHRTTRRSIASDKPP